MPPSSTCRDGTRPRLRWRYERSGTIPAASRSWVPMTSSSLQTPEWQLRGTKRRLHHCSRAAGVGSEGGLLLSMTDRIHLFVPGNPCQVFDLQPRISERDRDVGPTFVTKSLRMPYPRRTPAHLRIPPKPGAYHAAVDARQGVRNHARTHEAVRTVRKSNCIKLLENGVRTLAPVRTFVQHRQL
jgi:hypothetical protein